jgi:hypothetical protein
MIGLNRSAVWPAEGRAEGLFSVAAVKSERIGSPESDALDVPATLLSPRFGQLRFLRR